MRLSFQISLLFLSIYSFAIFLLPVLLHEIGARVFLLAGLISLIIITIFVLILFHFIRDRFTESKKLILYLIAGIFVLVNFLYFTNLIPPIPLSLKDDGVYHSIIKNVSGNYVVTYEDYGWRGFFKLYPDFHALYGATVYAYSAIFSPIGLDITIVDEWQHYDNIRNAWVTESEINLPVRGGREGGFRTYSARSNLAPGQWRVNIKTTSNQTVGRIRFNVVRVDSVATLKTVVK